MKISKVSFWEAGVEAVADRNKNNLGVMSLSWQPLVRVHEAVFGPYRWTMERIINALMVKAAVLIVFQGMVCQ
jgi:hypothetical protein